jgi:propionyl-CoA carboxylase alpha chain
MFKKILIANRGEIACRVSRTAKKMGIKTVAVYSEADKNALHVQMADEAILIGPAPATQSYLVAEKIIEACLKTGAQAVHPGYGFLSEKAQFQRDLEKAGLVFIGPNAHSMAAMGDKIESKKLAKEAGVNTVPGYLGVIKDEHEALKIAKDIGYPVMIKASAGGGGKGMRLAYSDKEVIEGFSSAKSEARSSFADDRVFIEKFIEHPRHIEIQILGDSYGHLIYLGERECSIQRRHQKVIEEAPSPFIDEKTRKAMGEQAVALAKAVGYQSAGTVEFIVDAQKKFYFLEMNTRLQVEHPVTELVTGLDLVEWMIRIAAGEKLTLKQAEVKLSGWALEARIYAENPFRKFLPSTGRLRRYRPPAESELIRLDTGVREGGEVSIYYDPMIAKLCSYGQSRSEAIGHLQAALDAFSLQGVAHNIPFLSSLLSHDRFIKGDLTTGFIAEEYPQGLTQENLKPKEPKLLAAAALIIDWGKRQKVITLSGQNHFQKHQSPDHWVIWIDHHRYKATIHPQEGRYHVTIDKTSFIFSTEWQWGNPLFKAKVAKKSEKHDLIIQHESQALGYKLSQGGTCAEIKVFTPRESELFALMPKKSPPDMSKYLLSPMPGLLVSLLVKEGQDIKEGDPLAIVEAMKMENILKAENDATIAKIFAKSGDSLAVDQKILEFL